MSRVTTHFLFWFPRILSIAFAIFLGTFALDVFSESHGFWMTALALAIHLIPSTMILAVLMVAWRWEWVGAGLYSLLAVYYAIDMLHRSIRYWPAVASISLPLLVIAFLFLASWLQRSHLRMAH